MIKLLAANYHHRYQFKGSGKWTKGYLSFDRDQIVNLQRRMFTTLQKATSRKVNSLQAKWSQVATISMTTKDCFYFKNNGEPMLWGFWLKQNTPGNPGKWSLLKVGSESVIISWYPEYLTSEQVQPYWWRWPSNSNRRFENYAWWMLMTYLTKWFIHNGDGRNTNTNPVVSDKIQARSRLLKNHFCSQQTMPQVNFRTYGNHPSLKGKRIASRLDLEHEMDG